MNESDLFQVKLHGSTAEIQLMGSIEQDPIAPFDLRPTIEVLVNDNDLSCVIVSLRQLTQCTTALINGLINLHKSLTQMECALKLCHVPPVIHQILGDLRLRDVFEVYPTMADALASL